MSETRTNGRHGRPFWQDRNVFVTGATGLVGSWLIDALLAHGANVVALIRDEVPHAELFRSGNHRRIRIVRGDLSSYELLERILAEYEVETVFHLAAQTTVGIANKAPLSTFETNIRGTWLLLEAARRNPTVCRFVAASSDTVYGAQAELPYDEALPLQAVFPYDISKTCVDLITRSYAQTYQLPTLVTRCSNLFGGGDLNWNRLIPGTIRSVIRGERPVIRSDGHFKRDYLYVKDAVRGYMMGAEQLDRPEVQGEAFNFGRSTPISALEMVRTIIRHSNHPELEPVILNQARGETDVKFVTAAKAARLLDWEPRFDLDRGVAETIAWYRRLLAESEP